MSAPSSDQAAIRQTLRVLKRANIIPTEVNYGDGEPIKIAPRTGEQTILDEITAVDDAFLIVALPDGQATGWIRFVMGNDPDEVICDYTVNLEDVLGPLQSAWFD